MLIKCIFLKHILSVVKYYLISAVRPIKTTAIFIVRSRGDHACSAWLNLFTNLFSDSQLHETGHTHHCVAPLKRVRTLDLGLSESPPKKSAIFPLLNFSSSNGVWLYFHELFITELFQELLCSQLASFVIECSNMLAVGRAKTLHSNGTHRLVGAYFLTIESDKRMRLFTGLYSIIV